MFQAPRLAFVGPFQQFSHGGSSWSFHSHPMPNNRTVIPGVAGKARIEDRQQPLASHTTGSRKLGRMAPQPTHRHSAAGALRADASI